MSFEIVKEFCRHPKYVLRYGFLNVTGLESLNTYRMHYEQFYVKYM